MSVETCSNSFATWPFTATRQVAREAAANGSTEFHQFHVSLSLDSLDAGISYW